MSVYGLKNGVDWYTKTTVCFTEYFPEGRVCCRCCRFCRLDKGFGTYACALTEEYLEKPDLDGRGRQCPVVLEATPF